MPTASPSRAALIVATLALACPRAAAAQDIRGLEVCSAEKQMERRTGCLQANIELLQQMLAKLARESNAKLATAERDLAAARAEIGTLKAAMNRLDDELAALKAKAAEQKK